VRRREQFEVPSDTSVASWERIYLTEGAEGLAVERRGRSSKGRPAKLPAAACGECLPKKLASLGFGRRATSAQKALVIRGLRQNFKLDILLEVAHLARATYYYHEKRMDKADKYGDVKDAIAAIYHENKGRYGYRRITTQLRQCGFSLNHKTVQRLMKVLGLICRVRMKKYHSYKGEVGKIAPESAGTQL
jgi:hypothetical protein